MCSIYLINVGANTSHSSQARSPIFNGNSFVYVSFCADVNKETHYREYPVEMLPFTSPHKDNLKTHNDPDWHNVTYGDDCSNPRAAALKNVVPGDILLFWGLLWHNKHSDCKDCMGKKDACWEDFSKPLDEYKGWYLLGAMRVEKIIETKKELEDLCSRDRCRAEKNIHLLYGNIPANHRIFLGDKDKKYSRLFDKAIELWIPKSKSSWTSSFLYKTFRSSDGQRLSLNDSPRWYSSIRPCRRMWDLDRCEECQRAEHVRDAIQNDNKGFDLLKDARC